MDNTLVAKLIGYLLMSRTYAHMAHLNTESYAKHKALNTFYEDLVDLLDELAEAAQGKLGKLDIPYVDLKGDITDPIKGLAQHQETVESFVKRCENPSLSSIGQEILALYYRTMYKLKELS